MEKFSLRGKCQDGCKKQLTVPKKKIFDINNSTVKSILCGENKTLSCDLNVNPTNQPSKIPVSLRSEILNLSSPVQMFRSPKYMNAKLLDHIYSKHGYPLAQGPAIPQIDKVNR